MFFCAGLSFAQEWPLFVFHPILGQSEESISVNWGKPRHAIIPKPENNFEDRVRWEKHEEGIQYSIYVNFKTENKKRYAESVTFKKRDVRKQADTKWWEAQVKRILGTQTEESEFKPRISGAGGSENWFYGVSIDERYRYTMSKKETSLTVSFFK